MPVMTAAPRKKRYDDRHVQAPQRGPVFAARYGRVRSSNVRIR